MFMFLSWQVSYTVEILSAFESPYALPEHTDFCEPYDHFHCADLIPRCMASSQWVIPDTAIKMA